MAEEDKVQRFIQVTQAPRAKAELALMSCDGNLNVAIERYFGGTFDDAAPAPPAAAVAARGEDDVRAPMRTGYTDNLMGNLETPADIERQAREKARLEEEERLQREKEEKEKLERDYEEKIRNEKEEAAKRKKDEDAKDDELEMARKAAAEKKARRKAEAAAAAAAAATAEAAAAAPAPAEAPAMAPTMPADSGVAATPTTAYIEMCSAATPAALTVPPAERGGVPEHAPESSRPGMTPVGSSSSSSATATTAGAFEAAHVQKDVAAGIRLLMSYKEQNPSGLRKCLETLRKIVDNLDKRGIEDKFRSIHLSSKTYQTNIAPFKGGLEVLVACGFREDEGKANLVADLSVYKKKGLSISGAIDMLDLVIRQLPES
mmetsp:Transcript_35619/g.76928  ORF Transcript_35619/g.76928 Transcript_35619/m.76928 type:complete len:375 (+) Transcript_35619:77-1201(+)